MHLPIVPLVKPTVLSGTTNGQLPDGILLDTPGQAGGATVRLVEPAARAWRALVASALVAGHVLKASGPYDSYRPYWVQEKIFLERYTTEPIATTTTRTWNGQTWYLKPGYAVAATPGTSNHGWGLAIDVAEEKDGDVGPESMDAETLQWLIDNERKFGFSHELESEPWHIRYVSGDVIPLAVTVYERPLLPPEEEMPASLWKTDTDPKTWCVAGDFQSRWHVPNQDVLAVLRYMGANGNPDTGGVNVASAPNVKAWLSAIPVVAAPATPPTVAEIAAGVDAVLADNFQAGLVNDETLSTALVGLAASVAALDAKIVTSLSDADLARIAQAVNDEAHRRSAA